MFDKPLADRLKSKSVKESIINSVARDFNLIPLLAEAYFSQIKEYFLHHTDIDNASGQMHYLAVAENEPAGKPIALCKKSSIKITLHKPDEDLEVTKNQVYTAFVITRFSALPMKRSIKAVFSRVKISLLSSPQVS